MGLATPRAVQALSLQGAGSLSQPSLQGHIALACQGSTSTPACKGILDWHYHTMAALALHNAGGRAAQPVEFAKAYWSGIGTPGQHKHSSLQGGRAAQPVQLARAHWVGIGTAGQHRHPSLQGGRAQHSQSSLEGQVGSASENRRTGTLQ